MMEMIRLKLWKHGGDVVVEIGHGDDLVVVVAAVMTMVLMELTLW